MSPNYIGRMKETSFSPSLPRSPRCPSHRKIWTRVFAFNSIYIVRLQHIGYAIQESYMYLGPVAQEARALENEEELG